MEIVYIRNYEILDKSKIKKFQIKILNEIGKKIN